jgi:hypothetical protein
MPWGKKYFLPGWPEQPRQKKNLLYRHDRLNGPKKTKEGPLSLVLFESPVTSVSTVSREPPLSGPSGNIKRGLLNFILFQDGGGRGEGGAWGIGGGNSVCNGIIVDLFLQVPMTVISTWFVQIWTPFMWIRVKGVRERIHQKFWNIYLYGNTINNYTEPMLRTTFCNCFFQL